MLYCSHVEVEGGKWEGREERGRGGSTGSGGEGRGGSTGCEEEEIPVHSVHV